MQRCSGRHLGPLVVRLSHMLESYRQATIACMPVDAHAAYVSLIGPDRRRSITFRHKTTARPAKFVLDSAAVHLNAEDHISQMMSSLTTSLV
jgi:hypothetical protein